MGGLVFLGFFLKNTSKLKNFFPREGGLSPNPPSVYAPDECRGVARIFEVGGGAQFFILKKSL